MKEIDLNTSVYDLVTTYPEIGQVLYDMGLKDIKNPAVLNTMGRYMTIPKGAKMKKVELKTIVIQLNKMGFIIKE
ncbi:protein of unknown function [Carnobacterium iners]|uniref:DUF1858 domain-containing protein n=1 Tax=Carnobacterium iners TaxID=1073423 RepID=A0A1X7MZ49_9LACT|nr:DUF1858 domain-containing protein [Carnobacterium iners]SEK19978.1 protein of unknown function [Carnobacterium iners]SMH30131.1 protein of unknown function [Carnobacterium iners]